MQMYAVVATGVLGLLIGFWSGRSIRWNMEETEEEAVNRQEERRITGNRQLVMEGTAIGSPVNGRTQRKKRRMTIRSALPSCRRTAESMLPLQEKC